MSRSGCGSEHLLSVGKICAQHDRADKKKWHDLCKSNLFFSLCMWTFSRYSSLLTNPHGCKFLQCTLVSSINIILQESLSEDRLF